MKNTSSQPFAHTQKTFTKRFSKLNPTLLTTPEEEMKQQLDRSLFLFVVQILSTPERSITNLLKEFKIYNVTEIV